MILNKFKLDGQLAVVTGGSKGLGRAIALALAQAGADIVLVSRSDNAPLRREIETMGRRCRFYAADLSDRRQTKNIFPEVAHEGAGPDMLVNCAGMINRVPNEDFPEEIWDATLELNLTAALILSQAAVGFMAKKGRGKIINVASVLSFQGGHGVPAYAASKHALVGLTRSCSNAWAAKGINVNAIAPGYFTTELTRALQDDPQREAALLGRVPAGRWGNPPEIGGAAVYLASAASDFVHGTVLTVDGGWLSA